MSGPKQIPPTNLPYGSNEYIYDILFYFNRIKRNPLTLLRSLASLGRTTSSPAEQTSTTAFSAR